jgi:hypothetical protein
MPIRRFPSPWSIEEQPACFIVRDHNGQQLAHVYFEDEPGRRFCLCFLAEGCCRLLVEAASETECAEFSVRANGSGSCCRRARF